MSDPDTQKEKLYFGYMTQKVSVKMLDEFTEFLKNGKLMGTKCKKCGTKYLPPRAACQCMSTEMEWIELPKEGKLATYSIIDFPPEAISNISEVMKPYIVGIAEFEGGLRLLAHITGLYAEPKIGMKLKVVPLTLPDNKIVYKLTPA